MESIGEKLAKELIEYVQKHPKMGSHSKAEVRVMVDRIAKIGYQRALSNVADTVLKYLDHITNEDGS